MFCVDSSGLFSAKAVSALDVMAAKKTSAALRSSSNGLWNDTMYDRQYMKCRDGSGGAAAGQPRSRNSCDGKNAFFACFFYELAMRSSAQKLRGSVNRSPLRLPENPGYYLMTSFN